MYRKTCVRTRRCLCARVGVRGMSLHNGTTSSGRRAVGPRVKTICLRSRAIVSPGNVPPRCRSAVRNRNRSAHWHDAEAATLPQRRSHSTKFLTDGLPTAFVYLFPFLTITPEPFFLLFMFNTHNPVVYSVVLFLFSKIPSRHWLYTYIFVHTRIRTMRDTPRQKLGILEG